MNVTITCPPFAKAPDAKFVITVNDSEHIGVFDTPAGTEIRISGTGAYFAFKKLLNEFQIPGFQAQNRTEVPDSYQRPSDTAYLVELLMRQEKPDSKSYGFLKDVVQKEQKWGLSAVQEKWLRDLAYRAYPDGLPKRTGVADGPKDARLGADELDNSVPF